MRKGFHAIWKCGKNFLECRVTGFRPFCLKLQAELKITLEIRHIQLRVSLQFTSEHELYIMNWIKPNLISWGEATTRWFHMILYNLCHAKTCSFCSFAPKPHRQWDVSRSGKKHVNSYRLPLNWPNHKIVTNCCIYKHYRCIKSHCRHRNYAALLHFSLWPKYR